MIDDVTDFEKKYDALVEKVCVHRAHFRPNAAGLAGIDFEAFGQRAVAFGHGVADKSRRKFQIRQNFPRRP
jgi:hypothetical protein